MKIVNKYVSIATLATFVFSSTVYAADSALRPAMRSNGNTAEEIKQVLSAAEKIADAYDAMQKVKNRLDSFYGTSLPNLQHSDVSSMQAWINDATGILEALENDVNAVDLKEDINDIKSSLSIVHNNLSSLHSSIVPAGRFAKAEAGMVSAYRAVMNNSAGLLIRMDRLYERLSGRHLSSPRGELIASNSEAVSDYGDTGAFDQSARNALFGLESQIKLKYSLSRELVEVQKNLYAPDLSAGLLNRPGAKYYLWTGSKLGYFVGGKAGDASIDQKNHELITGFIEGNDIKTPFYIVAYIPSSLKGTEGVAGQLLLSEGSVSFNVDGKEAHATRLAGIPVIPLGLIKSNPYLAKAKMAHETTAFESKSKGESSDAQHAAGLLAEFNALRRSKGEITAAALGLTSNIAYDYLHAYLTLNVKTGQSRLMSVLKNIPERYNKGDSPIFRAGLIKGLEYMFDVRKGEHRSAATALAIHYLSQATGDIERTACNYILNRFGDLDDKVASVREILKIATLNPQRDNNWLKVEFALTLLAEADIPEEVAQEVFIGIAKASKYTTQVSCELCPPILEKIGLAAQPDRVVEELLDEEFLHEILDPYITYYKIPSIKMLAHLAENRPYVLKRVKNCLGDTRTGNINYLIFMGNILPSPSSVAYGDFTEELNSFILGNNMLLSNAARMYRYINELRYDEKYRYIHEHKELEQIHESFVDYIANHKRENGVGAYMFLCSEAGVNPRAYIVLLGNIAQDNMATEFNSEIFPYAAMAINRLFDQNLAKDKFKLLKLMANNTYIDAEKLARLGLKDFFKREKYHISNGELMDILDRGDPELKLSSLDLVLSYLNDAMIFDERPDSQITKRLLESAVYGEVESRIAQITKDLEDYGTGKTFALKGSDYSDTVPLASFQNVGISADAVDALKQELRRLQQRVEQDHQPLRKDTRVFWVELEGVISNLEEGNIKEAASSSRAILNRYDDLGGIEQELPGLLTQVASLASMNNLTAALASNINTLKDAAQMLGVDEKYVLAVLGLGRTDNIIKSGTVLKIKSFKELFDDEAFGLKFSNEFSGLADIDKLMVVILDSQETDIKFYEFLHLLVIPIGLSKKVQEEKDATGPFLGNPQGLLQDLARAFVSPHTDLLARDKKRLYPIDFMPYKVRMESPLFGAPKFALQFYRRLVKITENDDSAVEVAKEIRAFLDLLFASEGAYGRIEESKDNYRYRSMHMAIDYYSKDNIKRLRKMVLALLGTGPGKKEILNKISIAKEIVIEVVTAARKEYGLISDFHRGYPYDTSNNIAVFLAPDDLIDMIYEVIAIEKRSHNFTVKVKESKGQGDTYSPIFEIVEQKEGKKLASQQNLTPEDVIQHGVIVSDNGFRDALEKNPILFDTKILGLKESDILIIVTDKEDYKKKIGDDEVIMTQITGMVCPVYVYVEQVSEIYLKIISLINRKAVRKDLRRDNIRIQMVALKEYEDKTDEYSESGIKTKGEIVDRIATSVANYGKPLKLASGDNLEAAKKAAAQSVKAVRAWRDARTVWYRGFEKRLTGLEMIEARTNRETLAQKAHGIFTDFSSGLDLAEKVEFANWTAGKLGLGGVEVLRNQHANPRNYKMVVRDATLGSLKSPKFLDLTTTIKPEIARQALQGI